MAENCQGFDVRRAQHKLIDGGDPPSEDLVAAGNHNSRAPALPLGRIVVGIFEMILQHLLGKKQLFKG